MAVITGAVGIVLVDRESASVLIHETNPNPNAPGLGATLWNAAQPATSAELVTRSMWLSLINRSLQDHRTIVITTDDATNLAISVMLADVTVDVGPSALPANPAQQLALLADLVGAER